ncbi:MAG: glycoside hydrolase family 32 protein, partial [Clostridia bacterium]|nr:glycoside hydrolase family 32 protein [Clostridia bacterium]
AALTEGAPKLSALTGLSGVFYGKSHLKETLPFGTKTMTLTATAENGSLSAIAEGAVASVSGKTVTVTDITKDFTLTLAVTAGALTRHYVISVKVEADPDTLYREEYRPQLHFSALVNWINDPNGLVYDPSNDTWHLFYQYNPYGLNIANQVWGHAVSSDLVHWKELDIAIEQDAFGAVFSGSCVVDENNTTGFFSDHQPGESKLVALYTSDGGDTAHGVEKQCIAYSKDHGVTWIKPDLAIDRNIVISNANDRYGRDFRDPKIFRYDNKWFMVIAGGRARLFTSDNLIDWTMVCDMGFDSECPDFYPLAVDGDPNHIKWVYTASGDWYIIGSLEKISETEYRFVKESDRIPYNGGGEVYATQSFYNDKSEANRRIGISWLQDYSASSLNGKTWNGAQSLPHEQTLRTVNGSVILTSYPVSEVDSLRGKQTVSLQNVTVDAADKALTQNPGKAYDLELVLKPTAGAVVALTLRSNASQNLQVVYDSTANKLRVIRARASAAVGNIPTGTMELPLYPDANGNVTIRVIMDTTVVEVFGNHGEAACTGYLVPDADAINTSLSVSGNAEIVSLKLWRMQSIWHTGEEILPDAGIYFDAPTSVSLNKETTVTAYYLNENGEREDASVSFGEVDTSLAAVISQTEGKLVLKGKREGKLTLTATKGSVKGDITLSVADFGFDSNLTGWTSGGDWYESEKGFSIGGSSGDSFAFSSVKHEGDFTYTGVADFGGKDGCLGLVFGATNPASPKSGTWYGANVDTHGNDVVIKLFCNTNGNEVWNKTLVIPPSDTYTLTVSYENDTLTYTVNGESLSRTLKNLKSGTLGLVSWNGGGSFNQVNYLTDSETPIDPSVTDTPSTTAPTPAVTTPSIPSTDTPTTDTPTTNTDKPKDGIPTGIVALLVAACLAGAAATFFTVKYILKKRKV